MAENTQVAQETRGRRKVRTGLVISDKMDKTVVVAIDALRPCDAVCARVDVVAQAGEAPTSVDVRARILPSE